MPRERTAQNLINKILNVFARKGLPGLNDLVKIRWKELMGDGGKKIHELLPSIGYMEPSKDDKQPLSAILRFLPP